jgi:hypothetical protein
VFDFNVPSRVTFAAAYAADPVAFAVGELEAAHEFAEARR